MSESKLTAPIMGKISDSLGQNQFASVAKVLEENLECDKEVSLVTESSSESDMSSTGDRQRQYQASPLAWTEPKRGRKIQTTSLLLKRKKKDKRRHKVLRLRGGCGDDENMDDGSNSNDEEDNDDDDGEGNYKQDKGKPDQNFTSDGGKASCVEGDERDARKESEMNVVNDPMSQIEGGKDDVSRTDDVNASGDPKAADHEAGDENDTKELAGRTSKRQRQDYQKYKDDMWETNFNDTSGEVAVPEEDSSDDDKEWAPEKKKRKVYEESTSDDEDGERGKKKSKMCRQKKTLPPGNKPLSPVIQGMLEKLAIEKADVSKERLTLNKLAASLVIHRWARKTNFPLLQQHLLPRHFREILSDYGRIGAGVISTTEATLKTCWQKHYCHDDSKLHKECYLCNEETWGDFANDASVSLEQVLDFDNLSEDESAEDGERLDAPHSPLPSTLNQNLHVNDQQQHLDPCPSLAKDVQELHLSPKCVVEMIATLRAKEGEIEQLKAALNNFEKQQHLTEGLENGTKSVSKELVTSNKSKDLEGNAEHKTPQFRCSLCEARYENYVSLVRHCRKKHKTEPEKPEKEYECDVCGKSYREKQVLEHHKKSVHNKPTCTFCSKPQSNLTRHLRFCQTKKRKTDRKKKQCPNCNAEFINLPSHLKLCLAKKTQPPPVVASSLAHQERFGLPMTITEQEREVERLGKIAELVDEMELVSATIASREGISLKVGIKTYAAGQCLLESVAAQLLHRRPQDAGESEPLVFQSLVDQLIDIEGKGREDLEQAIRIEVVDFLWDNELALDRFVYNPPGLAYN